MSNRHSYEALEAEYSGDSFRRSEPVKAGRHNQSAQAHRRGKAPQSVNGIHRRRKRKMSW